MRKIIAATAIALLCAACDNVDGPDARDVVGDWTAKTVGGYALPIVVKSGGGAIHTLYSSLTLTIHESGSATFSYDVSDLDSDDDSVNAHETCTTVGIAKVSRGVISLHRLADAPNSCDKEVVEGQRFVVNGDELQYTWNGYATVLKRVQ